MDDEINIAVDGTNDWWEMKYEIKTPYGVFKFYDGKCERMNLDQWRDFIKGKNIIQEHDDPVTRTMKGFKFSAGDKFGSNSHFTIEIDEKYLIRPLTMAIDKAIYDGWFGEEAQEMTDGLSIKGSED